MNKYEERQQQKKEYYEAKAASLRQAAENTFADASRLQRCIPMGQPMLIDHHSYRGDVAFREKIDRKMSASFDLAKKAEYYEAKAAGVGKGGISSDDPDAIEKLQNKMKKLEERRELYKQINKLARKEDSEGLAALGVKNVEAVIAQRGVPSFELTSIGAEIRRIKKRIQTLEETRNAQPVNVKTELYEYREEDNRCQFIFDGKPADEIRSILKAAAFKWSPSRMAWVRNLNGNGRYAAKCIMEKLNEM